MRLTLQRLHDEIKARKIRRALAIYVGFALPAIGIANMLENRYATPHIWFDRFLLLLVFGFIFTAIFAWYHGKARAQQFRPREFLIYTVLFASAAAAITFIPRTSSPLRPARTSPDKSIAVLPFRNFSDNKEDEFFSDGITEDILTQLSKIADLRVISRTTMMRYRETKKTLLEIGQELNVGTVLEGSVRKDGRRVRIVGQLIDARSDEHLWGETYDREIKDIFAIQSEVAQNIARALKAVLTPQEEERLAAPPTENIDAYALYLQGRQHYTRYSVAENERAIDFFKRASALDPSFGLASAGLSDAYSQRVQRYSYTLDWLDSARAAAEAAIRLAPESAEGYKALGLAFDMMGMTQAALGQYERAVELNPNYATALRNISLLNYRTGHLDRALVAASKAVSLTPDDVLGYVQVGMTLRRLGLDSAALAWYARARQIDPEHPFPLVGRGWLHLTLGQIDEARRTADTLVSLAPTLPPAFELLMNVEIASGNFPAADNAYQKSQNDPSACGAYILMKLGRSKEARETARASIDRCRRFLERGSESPTPLWEMATAFAVLDRTDSVLTWSGEAIKGGWTDYRWALVDPLFSSLRSNAVFQAQMSGVKERVERMRSAIPPLSR
jgi:TolB-like protein/Flp pilus assembly protein TadD